MSPMSVFDWIVAVLGGTAVIVLLVLPLNAGAIIYGTLFLVASGAAAYFHMGTWHAPVLAAMGVACWAGFFWGVRNKGKKR